MRISFGILALALAVPGGPSLAQLQVTKRDCKRLAKHVPSGDVAYRPGAGTRGRKFAPADVGGSLPIKLPDVFEFDVNIDIRKYLGGPEADAAAASAASIAADQAKSAATSAATAATAAETAATDLAAYKAAPANATLKAAGRSLRGRRRHGGRHRRLDRRRRRRHPGLRHRRPGRRHVV